MITLKRVYEYEDSQDGVRYLIERLWPRGVKKTDLRLDVWLKDVAPSAELRKSGGSLAAAMRARDGKVADPGVGDPAGARLRALRLAGWSPVPDRIWAGRPGGYRGRAAMVRVRRGWACRKDEPGEGGRDRRG